MTHEQALHRWMATFALWMTYPSTSERSAIARRHMRHLSMRYTLRLAEVSHVKFSEYQRQARARKDVQ